MSYRVCVHNPFLNCEKIYPIQQQRVRELIDVMEGDTAVRSITVFGSSTGARCQMWSDVDVYVEMNDDHNPIQRALYFPYDLWTNYSVDGRLLQEIMANGVKVYERRET